MPRERIAIDGLWRCLCPSADVTILSKLIGPPRNPRQRRIPCPSISASIGAQIVDRHGRRAYRHVASTTHVNRNCNDHESVEKARIQYLKRLAKRMPWIPGALLGAYDAFASKLDRISTKTIYATLKELTRVEGTYSSVVKLVAYLVQERNEKPNALLYESLIRANVDKSHGSAEVAGQLLKEMDKSNIPTTPQIYQALLDVTAVHPDYVLRNTVLFEMKNRWYSPTAGDLISIIVGLLRDNQYELALEKLEELHKDPVAVPTWLYDVFLYIFGDLGFHQETLSILKHRLKLANIVQEPLSLSAWQFLLEVFARDAFYDGIKYIWDRSVSLGYINPSDGLLLNILNAVSSHADAALAMNAIQMLSARGKKLELHHYDALIDIHAQQKDPLKAFTTLCIMAKADLRPDSSSTRSIFRTLRESVSETDRALEILHGLRSHYKVPPAAFNVVLEAIQAHHGFSMALDLYRSVRQICADGPDLETYHILLGQCTTRKSMNFLFMEIEAFSIEPTWATYDHLIRISSMQENYEQAFRFLNKMRSSKTAGLPNNWWLSRDSALALIRRCIQAEDIRVQELVQECRKRNVSIDAEVQHLLEAIQEQKGLVQSKVVKPLQDIQSRKLDAISSWV